MAATLDDLLKVLEEMNKRDDERSKSEGASVSNAFLKQVGNILGISSNITQPFAFMGEMNQMVQGRREFAASIDKQALAFNNTMSTLKQDQQVSQGVSDYGPTIALKTSIDALRTGMFKVSKDTFELGMQMRAAGENSLALFDLQKKSQILGGLNVDGMDSLAKALEKSRNEYGISTEYLVDSLKSLSSRLLDFNLMGITEDVNQSIISLVQKYGVGSADLFTKAMSMVTEGGKLGKFATLGISADVFSFLEKPTAEGMEAIAAQAGSFFEQQISGFASMNRAEAMAQAKRIYGEEGAVFAAIAKLTPAEPMDVKAAADSLKSQNDIQKELTISLRGSVDDLAASINTISSTFRMFSIAVGLFLGAVLTFSSSAKGAFFSGLTSVFTSITTTLAATFSTVFTAVMASPLLLLVGIIGIAAAAIAAFVYFNKEKEDKPIEIKPPKTGGQFITNEYMAANAELTKGILSSVFASQQMLMLAQQKRTNDHLQAANNIATKIARSAAADPIIAPAQTIGS